MPGVADSQTVESDSISLGDPLAVISTNPSRDVEDWVRVLSRARACAARRPPSRVLLDLHVDEVDDDDPADVTSRS